ncbi:MAG: reductive dehalogenase, partial [Alphaproteobacteria bacterium]
MSDSPRHPEDAEAGIEVTPAFRRFRQRDDIFSRAFWDPAVRSARTDAFFASYRTGFSP